MNYNSIDISRSKDEVNSFMGKVYSWMFVALLMTALTSYYMISNVELLISVASSPVFYLLIFGELGLVFYFSARIKKLSLTAATLIFLIYSVLNGVTLSVILIQYTSAVVYNAFLATSLTFGVMSGFGYFTKKDLSGWGSFFYMGLIGIIVASLVNIFIGSSTITWLVTYLGVFIFIGLTAYDTQKIKGFLYESSDEEGLGKLALFGALILYLDFINLFILLLRLLGRGDD